VGLRGSGSVNILPAKYNIRSKVHECRGGTFTISRVEIVAFVFTDAETNGVYQLWSDEIWTIVPGTETAYLVNFNVHPVDLKWILAVYENRGGAEVVHTTVAVSAETKSISTVAEGADFYSHPRFIYDRKRVC